jgi:hypothetical protein
VPTPNLAHSSSSNSQQYSSSQHYSHQSSLHSSSLGTSSFSSAAAGPPGSIAEPYRYPSVPSPGSASGHYSTQQQQQQPDLLPPYPAVPKALPMMPYTAPPDKVRN